MSDKKHYEQYVNAVEYSQNLEKLLHMERENIAVIRAGLESAERERDELRAEQAEHDEQIARMESKFSLAKRALDSKTARCEKAEAELRRRDAAAGEPVAWQYRYNDGKVGDWKTVDSESECNHSPCYERRAIYTAAPPAVLPPEKPVVFGSDLCQDIENYGYNLALSDTRQMGAQQQKVVELPERVTEKMGAWGYWDVFDADETIAALDAANVKCEVKK